jgi:hypothetical protein
MKKQFLRITDISYDFLLKHDPSEIEENSLLNINLNRVILNLLNSLGDFFMKETKALGLRKASLKKFLYREENKTIFSYGIWMSILEHNFKDIMQKKTTQNNPKSYKNLNKQTSKNSISQELRDLKNKLQQRIALKYISLMKKVQKEIKLVIEKVFFDVVAQAVFYSLFYAFPKSRINFDYDFRYFLFSLMSQFFVGLVVSPVSKFSQHWTFVDDWYLDLGAGNVLAKKIYHKKSPSKRAKKVNIGNIREILIRRF